MIRKSHFVLINEGGKPVQYPLKTWLRGNLDMLPDGMDPTISTSHALRGALQKAGWKLSVTEAQVFVIKPDSDGSYNYADEYINSLMEEALEESEEFENEEIEITFGLEKDLQTALRSNIHQLEEGLEIIDGGSEKTTIAGRIDITAKDSNGNIVIIELKAGMAKPESIAQILAYMSAVREEVNKPMRGFIIAGNFHERVILAAKSVPNLQLIKYSFQFFFNKIT